MKKFTLLALAVLLSTSMFAQQKNLFGLSNEQNKTLKEFFAKSKTLKFYHFPSQVQNTKTIDVYEPSSIVVSNENGNNHRYSYTYDGNKVMSFTEETFDISDWVTSEISTYSYNEQNRVSQIINQQDTLLSGILTNNSKYEFYYNINENDSIINMYNWANDQWILSESLNITTDANGNPTLLIDQQWQNGTPVIVSQIAFNYNNLQQVTYMSMSGDMFGTGVIMEIINVTYTYNNQDLLSDVVVSVPILSSEAAAYKYIYNENNQIDTLYIGDDMGISKVNSLEFSKRMIYSYDGANYNNITIQELSSTWSNWGKYEFIYSNGELNSVEMQEWNGSAWDAAFSKYQFEYDENGNTILSEYLENNGGTWVASDNEELYFTYNHNTSSMGSPSWDEAVSGISEFDYENIMSTMYKDIDLTGSKLEISYVVVGQTSLSENNNDNISIYPNPACNQLNIVGEVSNIVVFNAMGQIVYTSENNTQSINVSNWSNGIYMLRITDNNQQISTRKVLINK